jgi:hypothetical protein
MTESIPHTPAHKNLLLHPLTHAVYALDDDAVVQAVDGPPSNGSVYIDMPLDDFEKLTHTGPCSAERLVEYAKLRNGGFHYAQLVFLKLRDAAGGYAWASRIRVHTDWAVPDVNVYDSIFGQEFLWIWPTSAAINAFVCYQERNRLSMVTNGQLEQYAPAAGHIGSLPGAQIGPDDFDGVVQVPHDKLTSAQRLLIACIRPQRTQFQRRQCTDKWPGAMHQLQNKEVGAPEYQYHLKHKRGTTYKAETPDKSPYFNVFPLTELPSEIIARVVGTTVAVAMTQPACETAKRICTLRRVSKQICALTDGCMGLTLAQLTQNVAGLVRTGSAKAEAMLHVGADLRALGITPLLLFQLREMGVTVLRQEVMDYYPLLKSIRTVPRWQRYLRLRARLDKSVAAEARPVRITKRPSRVHKHVCLVNGVETVVHVPEYDEFIASGSSSPSACAMQLMERVGA